MPDEIVDSGQDASSPATDVKAALTGDEILERMAIIRLRIDEQSDEVVAQVNALSDWRSYVRRYPWASVGAAAVLGYVLVPSRAKPGAEGSTRDSTKHPAAFTTDELRSVLIGAARKAATAYVSKTLGAVDWGRSVTTFIVEHPELCLGIALAFGVAMGVVVKRR